MKNETIQNVTPRERSSRPVEPGTRIGHVHLKTADIDRIHHFYVDILGFDVIFRMKDALFLSAGGYHHHLGGNTWNSRAASPPPPGSAALRQAVVLLPDDTELKRVSGRVADAGQDPEPQPEGGVLVRDPAKNALLLQVDRK
jgi:catechol 2,3-dioxygenase